MKLRTLVIVGILAAAGLAMLGAANVENPYMYRLVGLVDTTGTAVSPATQDTLAAIGTVLGSGENVKTATATIADGTTVSLVGAVSGKQIVAVGYVAQAATATTFALYDAADANTETWVFTAYQGMVQPLSMIGWSEFTDSSTVRASSHGGTTRVKFRYVER